ncbi:hypothetical protein [Roseiconus lacunae]|uniref:hypothetical protein n=1 Tax=Roseiconus lacunae TaxID=2605694 RepID=UPI001E46C46F|nr:hypothetical protein [Roseiconus lacunae]MCD0462504.1 hypothetical protein [Roseiconus lacunae]
MKDQVPASIKWKVLLLAARPIAMCSIATALFGVFAAPEHGDALLGLGLCLYVVAFIGGWTGKLVNKLFYE